MRAPALHVIRSASDVGSAVAHALKGAASACVLLEGPQPGATRRAMCLAGAVHTGSATLEGLRAERCATPAEASARAAEPGLVPLLVCTEPAEGVIRALAPAVLVDARMRKRAEPEVQRHLASLVIGIGPGFRCGVHAHAVVESNWGETLGAVLWQGAAQAYTGRHREVEGHGRDRYVYAPHAGRFSTTYDVAQPVAAGEVVAHVDGTPLAAPIAGLLRGLAYDGLAVEAGAKLIEIDPTGDAANGRGIAIRPARIAEGVLRAIEQAGRRAAAP